MTEIKENSKDRGGGLTKQSGSQVSFIALSEDEIVEIIRPEENLERHQMFIFPHARTKGLDQLRKHSWDVSLQDGREAIASIAVDPASSAKAYTWRTYDVYKALVTIWDSRGMPAEPFETSLTEIAKQMEVPTNGRMMKAIQDELTCLYKTTLSWSLSFKGEKSHQTVKNQHILETFDYSSLNERAELDDRFEKVCVVRFDKKIQENHRAQRTIPVNRTALKAITSPIAKVLYNRVDSILSKHSIFERTARNLVQDLYLTLSRYKYKSQRKQLVDKLNEQLNGLRLSNMKILTVAIQETADGSDWKCVFRSKDDGKTLRPGSLLPIVNSDPETRERLVHDIGEVVGGLDMNTPLYNLFALHYSEDAIYRAIGEFKELTRGKTDIKNKRKYFTVILHMVIHKRKGQWIKDCGPSCKYREENNINFKYEG